MTIKPAAKNRPSRIRSIGLLAVSLVVLSIATLITLAQIPPPQIQTEPIQMLLNQLAAEGQPPRSGDLDAFWLLMEASVMAMQVAERADSLPREASSDTSGPGADHKDSGFDYRSGWVGWGADPSQRDASLAGFMLLYADGFLERIEAIAAAPRIARNLTQLVFLARRPGEQDERAVESLVQALVARMLIAAEEKRPERLVAAADQALAVARACALQPRASNWILGANLASDILFHVRLLIAHDALDQQAAQGLLEAIDRRLPLAPIARPINARRFGSLAFAQDELTNVSKKSGPQSYLGYLIARVVRGDYSRVRDLINAHYDRMIAETSKPYCRLRTEGTSLESLECPSSAYWARYVEPPRLPHFALARDRLQVMIEGTRVALALHLHRKQRGGLPATLQELTPAILPSVTNDPFDPTRPLTYRQVSGTQGYLLYSVGPDGVDDGGKQRTIEFLNDSADVEDGADQLISTMPRRDMIP